MNALVVVESGFRLKRIWWTGETFTNVLCMALNLYHAMSNHRVAFHFGVSEKTIRKLRARSDTTNGVILHPMEKAKLSSSKPVQYRKHNWYNDYPEDIETRKMLMAAKGEKER